MSKFVLIQILPRFGMCLFNFLIRQRHLFKKIYWILSFNLCIYKKYKFTDLENFVTGPNVFNIHGIGDKGFNKELYFPFKILFYKYQQ